MPLPLVPARMFNLISSPPMKNKVKIKTIPPEYPLTMYQGRTPDASVG